MELNGDEWFALYQKSAEGKLANYDQITEHIYLSGYQASENYELLTNVMKVSAILTVADSLEQVYPHKFTYKQINITDDEGSDMLKHLRECINFIEEVVS